MNTNQNYAIILNLMEQLYTKGNWCGETHVQKNVYMLKHLKDVPLTENFVLYKHGPYSFELHDVLGDMRILGFIEEEQRPPYGPRLKLSELGRQFMLKHFSETFTGKIEEITDIFKKESVQGFEKLATALYLKLEFPNSSDEERANRLHAIKPHISTEDAKLAIEKINQYS